MIQARIQRQLCVARRPDLALDLEFSCAGITTLFGPHGSGKSAVLECISGLLAPGEGRILVDDKIVFDSAAGVNLRPASRPCVYIPGEAALFPHLSVEDNLLFAASCRGVARLEHHRIARDLLERFGLAAVAKRFPAELLPAETLRGVLARALAGRPTLLLVDDMARSLDEPLRAELLELLRWVHREWRVTVLAASSDTSDCLDISDQMLVLESGRLAQQGHPRQILDQPASVAVARALGGFALLTAEIVALDPGRNTSRLRLGEAELTGPYFPGRFLGDRVTICVRPAELKAAAGAPRPGANQVAARLDHVVENSGAVRLVFEGGMAADVPRQDYEQSKHRREWAVEFPAAGLRVL